MDYQFDWSVLLTQRHLILSGLLVTLKITFISLPISLALGAAVAIGNISPLAPVRRVARAYVEIFRNTPLLLQLFFWYFAFPSLLPGASSFRGMEFFAAVIALSIYTGAYMAEAIRASIQSVSRGQWEASLSTGLSFFQTLGIIVIPQAIRVAIPPLTNQFLNLTKNSSLAMTIGVAEVTFQSQAIEAQTFRGFEATTAATLIYILISITISRVTAAFENLFRPSEGTWKL